MALVQPINYPYATTKLASGEIDAETIMSGCDQIDAAAADFTTVGNKINESSSLCGPDALEIDGTTMINSIEECGSRISEIESEIKGITATIRETAENKYNQLQNQYNEEARQANEAAIQKMQEENTV